MGRLVLIGGGTYEEIDPIAAEIVRMTAKNKPNVLFIGTALQDSTNPLTSCKKTFKRVAPGCIVKKLSLIRSSYTDDEIDSLIAEADIIFVGGGNTVYMLEEWKKRGLQEKLARVYREDTAVLAGISAGAVCWCSMAYTDSDSFLGLEEWHYRMMEPGINLLDIVLCPHYNVPGRESFDREILSTGKTGIALEDDTALIDNQGEIGYIRCNETAHVWRFMMRDGAYVKEQMI